MILASRPLSDQQLAQQDPRLMSFLELFARGEGRELEHRRYDMAFDQCAQDRLR